MIMSWIVNVTVCYMYRAEATGAEMCQKISKVLVIKYLCTLYVSNQTSSIRLLIA